MLQRHSPHPPFTSIPRLQDCSRTHLRNLSAGHGGRNRSRAASTRERHFEVVRSNRQTGSSNRPKNATNPSSKNPSSRLLPFRFQWTQSKPTAAAAKSATGINWTYQGNCLRVSEIIDGPAVAIIDGMGGCRAVQVPVASSLFGRHAILLSSLACGSFRSLSSLYAERERPPPPPAARRAN